MTASTYDDALRRVLADEGGYSNDTGDPGGPTNYGITIHDVRAYLNPNATADDVRALTVDQAETIYKAHYADPLRYDDLPAGVDYAVLDYGINSGIGRAARVLQQLVGLEGDDVDGMIGPDTLEAVAAVNPADLVRHICDERLAFLQGLSAWPRFGRGWGSRVAGVRVAAVAMAQAAGSSKPPMPAPTIIKVDLAAALLKAMKASNFAFADGADMLNIIYVEGMDPDGIQNDNAPNKFNDLRCLLRVVGGVPSILGKWEATTQPGRYWTEHRMNPAGAFIIALGQQAAWVAGAYHNAPALVQNGPLQHYRDNNNDYKREGKIYVSSDTGVHHHGGYNLPHDDLGRSSAGCLVGRMVDGHAEFMRLVKTDARYVDDDQFLWPATILTAAQVLA